MTAIVYGAWKEMVQWIELACLWALVLVVDSGLRVVASMASFRPVVFELVVLVVPIGFYWEVFATVLLCLCRGCSPGAV